MKEIEYSICIASDCTSQHTPCPNGCDNVIGKCRTQENPEVTEKTTCIFMNSEGKHNCCFKSRYGGEACCEGEGNCTIDSFGFRYNKLDWTSDCATDAQTLLDGAEEKISFDCDPNKCKLIGLRETSKYCSADKIWSNQKGNKNSCENSFECVSNNCKGGICTPICTGCFDAENVCIPFGTRTSTQYCDIDFSFKNQLTEDSSCKNNYECTTNLCVNKKCISPSFIQKIMDWFKKIFG